MENGARQGFIFSPRVDVLVFLGPLILVAAILIVLTIFGLDRTPLSPRALFLYSVLLNLPHVYSTFLRVYGDADERSRLSPFLWIVPLGSFILAFFFHRYFPQGLLFLAAYLAMFHHVRQQYGLMVISSKRSGSNAADLFWDKLLIYSLTIFCLLKLHTLSSAPQWFDQGDMLALSPQMIPALELALVLLVMAYYGRLWRERSTVAWGKQLIIVSTLLSWLVSVSARSFPLCILLLGLNHNLTYLFFIFHYGQRKKSPLFVSPLAQALAYAFLIVLALIEEWAWATGADILVPFLYVPQLSHYFLDGLIWRRGHYTPQKKKVDAAEIPLKERFKAWAYPLMLEKKTRSPNSQ